MSPKLSADRVRNACDPGVFDFVSTNDITPLQSIVGQERAIKALEFGLDMRRPGFNIFVSGQPGTGKAHAVQRYLHNRAEVEPVPPDWCYVYNFQDSYRPKALSVPAGRGKELTHSMETLVKRARADIVKAFESEEYTSKREEITDAVRAQQERMMLELNAKTQPLGFMVQATQLGMSIIPVRAGRPLTEQEFLALSPGDRQAMEQGRAQVEASVEQMLKSIREMQRTAEERLESVSKQVTRYVVGGLFDDLEQRFKDCPAVVEHLNAAEHDLVENVAQFLTPPQAPTPQAAAAIQEVANRRYLINLIVDNSNLQGAPVVVETNPTFPNLFGRLEREAAFGVLQTDFTLIKGGAFHRANGGYLVLNTDDVFRNPGTYEGLKRTLRDRSLLIEDLSDRLGLATTKSLQPDPIPLEVKVVLLGNPLQYQILFTQDEEFREVFKVKADFDNQMERDRKNVQAYADFASGMCQREGLRPLDAPAVAKLVELGSRLADDQQKLTTRFSELADVLREADHWARQSDSDTVKATHIQRAVDAKTYRANLIEERLREMITRGTIRVDTKGAVIGQVNGLAVLAMGDYLFGKPSRITATIALGQAGVVDIEREARLGGATHTKGVLILSGYLAAQFAQDKPLTLSARLVFEQSYEGVDGDSASSTELYALLSALSGVPIKQSIAVTGSVDQAGNVQAIGGVNQKIEGFFDVCRMQGLTGKQGVLIPSANVRNLMLREDVAEAIAQQKFHLWAVSTISEGIDVLTGTPAGERTAAGKFKRGTVNYLVDQRLRRLAASLRTYRGVNGAQPRSQSDD
jgi:lon-related putative ATP-dependent protease